MSYGGGTFGSSSFGSGGFMDSASQDIGVSQWTQGYRSGGPSSSSRDKQTLIPVTIRQLHNLQKFDNSGALLVDGHEVALVEVVGLLVDLALKWTNVRFKLDDGTGVLDGQLFLLADDAEYAEKELREGIYVRAVSKLRLYNERVSLSCFRVTPVMDFNQVTHHFLEAVYVHVYNTRGPLLSTTGAGDLCSPVKQPRLDYNRHELGFGVQPQSPWSQGSLGLDAPMSYSMDASFSTEQTAILNVLASSTSDCGVRIDRMILALRPQMNETRLRDALEYLTNEGHVYSTIDKNHFKRTT